MRRFTLPLAVLVLFLSPRSATASFVKFWECVEDCHTKYPGPNFTKAYWLRVACILDCELDLAKEVREKVIGYHYSPTLDPRDLNINVAGNGSTFPPGAAISANLLLLNPGPGYVFGNVGTTNEPATFDNLLSGNTFTGTTDITHVDVRALPISTYIGFSAAADVALNAGDSSVGLQNPLWSTAPDLYSGSPSGIVLNTSGLTGGTYILRIESDDSANGGAIFGLGTLDLLPEPGSLTLFGTGVLLSLIGYGWRYRPTGKTCRPERNDGLKRP